MADTLHLILIIEQIGNVTSPIYKWKKLRHGEVR